MRTLNCAVKSLTAEDEGRFTGRAAVYGNVDSYDDIIVPGAFTKSLARNGTTVKVLYQHDTSNVIGLAQLTDRADGLWASGRLELDLPSAKDAYTRLRAGLVDGISIGYETVDYYIKDGVRYLKEVNLHEISLVTFPANSAARVTNVKAGSAEDLRALSAGLRQLRAHEEDAIVRDGLKRLNERLTRAELRAGLGHFRP